MIDKEHYFSMFAEHAKKCLAAAEKKQNKKLPETIRCIIGTPELYEDAVRNGSVKYLGGRMLAPEQMNAISVYKAAKYTYVDGEVPYWVNLYFEGSDNEYSYIRVLTSEEVTDNESKLYDMPEGTKQFHILLSGLGR